MSNYYSKNELAEIGFASIGEDVNISRRASIYSPNKISIGNHVRIDDFVFISGGSGIKIGNYVHIAVASSLYGKFGIEIGDYVNISGKVTILSASDDYSGACMTGPLVDENFVEIVGGKVIIENHVIIGTGSVIMPNIILAEGTAIGALSFVKKSTEPFSIYAGIPAKKIRDRQKRLKDFEIAFKNSIVTAPPRLSVSFSKQFTSSLRGGGRLEKVLFLRVA